jgi:hypothetical protein
VVVIVVDGNNFNIMHASLFVSFRFVSFRFVSFRFVSFRFVSLGLMPGAPLLGYVLMIVGLMIVGQINGVILFTEVYACVVVHTMVLREGRGHSCWLWTRHVHPA